MWAALKNVVTGLFGFVGSSGGQGIISQGLDIAAEKVLDVDKLVSLIKDVLIAQIQSENNPSWVNALGSVKDCTPEIQHAVALYIRADFIHKLCRTALWLAVIVAYVVVAVLTKQPMDLQTLALLSAGPGLYTMLKGAGRK